MNAIKLVLTLCYNYITGLKREEQEFTGTGRSNAEESRIEDTEDDDVFRTLTIRKGHCPNKAKGIFHHIMNLAWHTRKVETILESDHDDLIYVFYVSCVSRIVRKRKWNECSQVQLLHQFVDPSDEAFAMLVLENNVSKWMDELRHGATFGSESRRKTLYTEGQKGRGWSKDGIIRFIELWKLCNEYRGRDREKVDQYRHIEIMVNTREKIWNDNSSRKRRKVCNDVEEIEQVNEEEDEMERCLQAMANGE